MKSGGTEYNSKNITHFLTVLPGLITEHIDNVILMGQVEVCRVRPHFLR